MRIANIEAFPTSFPVPPGGGVALGVGRAVKRDAVIVKVTTDDGLVGWGESHHGRAHTAVAASAPANNRAPVPSASRARHKAAAANNDAATRPLQ